ncbi:MAG TPA: bifunctional ADP-heptose synthase [Anaerolineae bacterium]|nr:bifunctional ADP-heptose synthase [Anaerolineae bacterium]
MAICGIEKEALLAALPKLRGLDVLVLGDLVLDEYVVGRATRLSREAPVPVLEFLRRFFLPGGAANPAQNISALRSTAHQVGVVGDDDSGRELVNHLQRAGIRTDGLVVDRSRPTTTKTRILAEGTLVFPQQLARIDQAQHSPLGQDSVSQLVTHLGEEGARVDALLISDYKMGVVNEQTIAAALRVCRERRIILTVDSQGDLLKFRGFDVVKCNRREAEALLGRELRKDSDYEEAGASLLADLGSAAVILTRGDEGMSLVSEGGGNFHIPAANRSEVFDVTGAGDTVIAVVTLALAAGLEIVEAALLANYAAGLVVRKLGNATPSEEELGWAIEHWPESRL